MDKGTAAALAIVLLVTPIAGCSGGESNPDSGGIEGLSQEGFDPPERPAPDFDLVNQDGENVSMQELRGKVVVVDFIYTSCTSVCPILTSKFKKIQKTLKEEGAFGDEVVLVSISFDPQRDTKVRLRDFGNRFGADYSGWHFLRPESEDEAYRVISGFGGHFEPEENDTDEFLHTAAAVVVNPEGKIVKEFHGQEWDPDAVSEAALEAAR